MDEMNIWEEYDEIMLKKAENRYDRQPKKGNEKNIFEELLKEQKFEKDNKFENHSIPQIASPK